MVQLLAVGDIALCGDYADLIQKEGAKWPFTLVASRLREGDIVLGNLETPLSDQGRPDPSKPICLRGPSAGVEVLVSAGFTHVSLANNHSYDYGVAALRDTQRGLAQAGIAAVGVGGDLAESRRSAMIPFEGGTLALLAYNAYTTGGRCYARVKQGGVAPLEYRYIKADIQSLRKRYEPLVIVISLHWGIEGNHYPTLFQRYLAHRIIEDGADLILGSHPHVIQGVEQYRNGVIAYSLGNFCFSDVSSQHIVRKLGFKQQPENRESFIFKCEVTPDGIKDYQVIPIYIKHSLQPCLASGQRRSDLLEQLTRYSEPLSDADYEEFYEKKVEGKEGYGSRLRNLLEQEGFSGLQIRLRPGYLRALAIAFWNWVREARHQRQVLQKVNEDRGT